MSYQHGLAAINLEMPGIVPRTEFSADFHWNLVSTVLGKAVDSSSDYKTREKASEDFVKAWNYSLCWNVLTGSQIFGNKRTFMGHAVYAADGVDFIDEKFNLFESYEDVYNYDMFSEYTVKDKQSLINDYNNNYADQVRRWPECIQMTGIYVTCMSGMIDLLGWDTLLEAAGNDSKAFGEFVNRYSNWMMQYFEALACCDSPVVMIHDDLVWSNGPFLHPDFYRKYIFPNIKKMLLPLREAGKKILFTSDGDFTMFVDDIADCGVNGFVLEPLTDMTCIAEKYGQTHVIIGNADTRILLRGSFDDIEAEVKRCMDIGKKCPGYFLAVGNHIPPNTPVDNALFYNDIYEKLKHR